MNRTAVLAVLWLAVAAAGAVRADPACDPDNGGLTLADGFCATLFADDTGPVRNLVVSPEGDVFAALRGPDRGVLALRDLDGDGRADVRERFGHGPAHGIALSGGHLYLATRERVVRWPWKDGQLAPSGDAEVVLDDLPQQSAHADKGLAVAADGSLFVAVGAPSNACQERARIARSPGIDPCPQLERHAGVWRFPPASSGSASGQRFATGLRHTLALALHPETGALWGAVNGRDQLGQLWGYSDERNAELPAEQLVEIGEGQDFGWPYCYLDGLRGRKVLAPEYGGDGTEVGRCAVAAAAALSFPAHWAPMDLAFAVPARNPALPEVYRNGAFVAFRGSWNRAPLPQQGYRVSFVPFREGRPTGDFHTFAIGADSPTETRMTGVALAPGAAVFLAAETNERVWRVVPESPAP